MSNIEELKELVKTEPGKRLCRVEKIDSGSVLVKDFLGRTFSAIIQSDLCVSVGDNVIVVSGVVIGKTRVESEPKIYQV